MTFSLSVWHLSFSILIFEIHPWLGLQQQLILFLLLGVFYCITDDEALSVGHLCRGTFVLFLVWAIMSKIAMTMHVFYF